MADLTPSLSDLKFAYYGGGNDAEMAFLMECYAQGITAFDLIGLVGGGGGGGGVTVHNLLTGRSTADGHPMGAVTGLTPALAGKADVAALNAVEADANAALVAHEAEDDVHPAAFDSFASRLLQFSPAFLADYLLIYDDFLNDNIATGQIGDLGWFKFGSGVITAPVTDLGARGYLNFQAATIGELNGIRTQVTTLLGPQEFVWATRCLFSHSSSCKYLVGLVDLWIATNPANGAWFELDAAVDTNLHARSRNASGTIQDTNCGPISVGGGAWHRYEIRSDGGGNLTYFVDDTQVAAHTTVPAAGALMAPTTLMVGNIAATRNLRLDWHYLLAARA